MKRNPRVCMSGHNTNEEVELKGIVWYATHNWPRSPIGPRGKWGSSERRVHGAKEGGKKTGGGYRYVTK